LSRGPVARVRPDGLGKRKYSALTPFSYPTGRQGGEPTLRVATWNIAGARREGTDQVHLDGVLEALHALDAELLAVQEVDRELARSGRTHQPKAIAEALGPDWFWSFAPALVGDDFRPIAGPDPGGPAYGNLLLSRLPLQAVEHLRFPPAGGGEQRSALIGTIQVGSGAITVAATHLSNKLGHNVRQLRELEQAMEAQPAPRLLLGDLNLPSTALLLASRRGWLEAGRGRTFPNSRPTQQLDHILRNDEAQVLQPRRVQVLAEPVSDHRALVIDFDVAPP
jgi:endonuclease/exonuclease/phosphatase family metal-dependent hydrolase